MRRTGDHGAGADGVNPISVLVVEDETMTRAGLVLLLDSEADIVVIGQAADGREAIDRARELEPEVILMDLRLPLMSGVEATQVLTADASGPHPGAQKVLVLTTFDDDDRVRAALRAGASGYLLKHTAPDMLGPAIRKVAAGEAWIDPAVAGAVLAALRGPDGTGRLRASALELRNRLTVREQDVLTLIARGMTNDELAAKLFVAVTTVRTHVSRILTKTGSRSRAEAVIVAYESGLLVPGLGETATHTD